MAQTAQLALFDLDNTLFDRARAFRGWCDAFIEERSLDPSIIDWLIEIDHDGAATREAVFSALRDRCSFRESAEELEESYRRTYPLQFHPDPLILEGLVRLRTAGWAIGIVTNGPATQEEKIRRLALDSVVDGWCISDVVGAAKPSPSIFERAAAQLGAPLSGYMVGDQTETDILGGKQVGLRTILVSRGRELSPNATRPDEVVLDVYEAIELIGRSNSSPSGPSSPGPTRR